MMCFLPLTTESEMLTRLGVDEIRVQHREPIVGQARPVQSELDFDFSYRKHFEEVICAQRPICKRVNLTCVVEGHMC